MKFVDDEEMRCWLRELALRPEDEDPLGILQLDEESTDWDRRNYFKNFDKHGFRAEEIETILENHPRLVFWGRVDRPDLPELRWVTSGTTVAGRDLFVVFTRDYDDSLRVISARPLSRKERRKLAMVFGEANAADT